MTLSDHWELARTLPDFADHPAQLPATLPWIAAPVPGTAASALRQAGLWDGDTALELDRDDIWYRAPILLRGPHRLCFAGLATLATIWVNGTKRLDTANMFRSHECDADLQDGFIHIRFRSLLKALEGKRGRPRWRPRMIVPPSLRSARTTLLGHMPGWCPSVHAVGPWRSIEALPLDGMARLQTARLHAGLQENGTGILTTDILLTAPLAQPAVLRIGRWRQVMETKQDRLHAALSLPAIEPWWPHTHGTPRLHDVTLEMNGHTLSLGRVGFRRIERDPGEDGQGFGLRVNGVKIFCRGANWITADLAALPTQSAAFLPWLQAARDAGMNMLRLPGVGIYEADAFYELCDELGLLVWQDAMFANFDYPAEDPAFRGEVEAEVTDFLHRTSRRACLAVLCGGSEIAQQAAMLGVPEAGRANALFDDMIPGVVKTIRPDLLYTPHSPHGAALPFLTDRGVCHYYGVGAYQRPLEDARRAGVRFASECLAFANVPEEDSIARGLRVWQTHDPRWKASVPRDAGASWDFEDVRDHYLALLFKETPAQLRYNNPARYLDLSRAVVAELMEAAFAEWRRPGSSCAGALVWTLQDLRHGAGWGVLDRFGHPKSAWYALRRAFRPVHLALTDEGLNGLALHAMNDTCATVRAVLSLQCLAHGRTRVAAGSMALELPPRAGCTIDSAALLESFFDITYAYRFGPPAHDVSVARLMDRETGCLLAESFHFPQGWAASPQEIGLQAALHRDSEGWRLRLRCDRFAQSVHVQDRAFKPEDCWFHMAPDHDYELRLIGAADAEPQGEVLALNAISATGYGGG